MRFCDLALVAFGIWELAVYSCVIIEIWKSNYHLAVLCIHVLWDKRLVKTVLALFSHIYHVDNCSVYISSDVNRVGPRSLLFHVTSFDQVFRSSHFISPLPERRDCIFKFTTFYSFMHSTYSYRSYCPSFIILFCSFQTFQVLWHTIICCFWLSMDVRFPTQSCSSSFSMLLLAPACCCAGDE